MKPPRKDEPVRLSEDTDTGDRFLFYGTDRGVKVELRYAGETLWATQDQMAEMFGVNVPSISRHLKNVFAEGELDPESTVSKIERVAREGQREVRRSIEIYNLNAIIAVGYRVSSRQGTMFRIWATDTLVQFATKGFVVDSARLKHPEAHDRVVELREIIRDIRSDEANVYREVRRICAMCQDYDPASSAWRDFYARMQAKLMWAVTSQTPAMLVSERADAARPSMGLRTWPKDDIRQQDALVAKNYLAESEVRELNRLTTILLDIFEDQLDIGKLTTMGDAEETLDRQLRSLNRPVLNHGGSVRTTAAERHAKEQYRLFDAERRARRRAEAESHISDLLNEERALRKTRRKNPKHDDN
ncbi:MAG TPA: RhuM family protein [Hyphomicrobium sp.]|nr:RhuM family protein [Hyphomicrobium sp.]